jgi:hypothetical protein
MIRKFDINLPNRTKLLLQKMKILLLSCILFVFYSCTSEYHERLKKGAEIQTKILELESQSNLTEDDKLFLQQLKKDLLIQAKISGNEDRYFSEVSN